MMHSIPFYFLVLFFKTVKTGVRVKFLRCRTLERCTLTPVFHSGPIMPDEFLGARPLRLKFLEVFLNFQTDCVHLFLDFFDSASSSAKTFIYLVVQPMFVGL